MFQTLEYLLALVPLPLLLSFVSCFFKSQGLLLGKEDRLQWEFIVLISEFVMLTNRIWLI